MKATELAGAHVLVAGAGISGRAAAAALLRLGARVTVTDAPTRLTRWAMTDSAMLLASLPTRSGSSLTEP